MKSYLGKKDKKHLRLTNHLVGCCFFLFLSINTNAQVEENDVTTQYWTDYNFTHLISDKLDLKGSIGARVITPYIWFRYYIKPSLVYNNPSITILKKEILTSYHVGIGIFHTNNIDAPNLLEIRPFQGVKIESSPNKTLQLGCYIRLEERLEYSNNNDDFGMRARFKFSGIFKPKNASDKQAFFSDLYFPMHVELFWSLEDNSQFNDVMRIIPGIGYFATLSWKMEFSAAYFKSKNITTGNFETNDIVFRLRLFHDF